MYHDQDPNDPDGDGSSSSEDGEGNDDDYKEVIGKDVGNLPKIERKHHALDKPDYNPQ